MSVGDITYRAPSPDEWADLKALRIRSVAEHPIAFGSSLEKEEQLTEEQWRERMETRRYIIAVSNGTFVGSISMTQGEAPKSSHVMSLYSVYVAPEFRNRGVGRELLNQAIETAKTHPEIIKLSLNVAATQSEARALYTKMGFEEVGVLKKEIFVDGQYIDECVMELMLS